ncbi:cytochrome c biogenesis protein CcdA [Porphyromonas sp. oral taxon 275]|uniref:protein-disulfide reductase DsbD family protein n=1 Tax=Porphyromonas sp. oral taxon 275 TaxID=712435 RepID=UPI001BA8E180|nr:cytochrome c biogenesis protein CcdA [Porphyromonas sp. oral taxon 275]QUB43537.1 thioredoxin family protein [Porphyromonas sp. oral taxon 275]
MKIPSSRHLARRLGALLLPLALLLTSLGAKAQIIRDAVSWSHSVEDKSPTEKVIVFSATIKGDWHLYGTELPSGGPTPTSLIVDKIAGAQLVGKLTASKKPIEKHDPNFDMTLRFYSGQVSFRQTLRITDPKAFAFSGAIRYMVCNDEQCLPPTNWDFTIALKELGKVAAAPAAEQTEAKAEATPTAEVAQPLTVDSTQQAADSAAVAPAEPSNAASALWTPVISELKAYGDRALSGADSGLLMLFFAGFVGGLVALVTPCVWPMIPMTVSFFLKRSQDRKKGIRDAAIYGLAIIVIYLALGLSVSALFGADALNNLATNAYFNIFFFLLLVVFAASFFGAFEIVLPASWTTKMDQKADSATGLVSIFFMAFTLALVSFSCTGPIIGTLLVQAATSSSGFLAPAVGMFGFALALALPFTLFAIFPGLLQSMPKSGGWMNSVKVVLAFIELALALKFLSIADLAYGWHILDREVFLSLWIVIFILLGLYLLGKLRFPHDSPQEKTPIPALFLAIVSLSFAVYMMPGLIGAPLRAISAFAPPLKTQDLNLYKNEVHAQFDDYETGMAYARQVGKPVIIDFSGYGCVNCRKMEASVWIDAEVKKLLEQDYVLITLMVDDKKPLAEPMVVQEDGHEVKLRTIGDKWSYLQRVKFGANAQPFYVLLDHQGKPLAPSRAYDEDVPAYISFLKGGLSEFASRTK